MGFRLTGARREYYERNNQLLQHYMYIDRLLDSSLPHNLIEEYTNLGSGTVNIPSTISEESSAVNTPSATTTHNPLHSNGNSSNTSLTSS